MDEITVETDMNSQEFIFQDLKFICKTIGEDIQKITPILFKEGDDWLAFLRLMLITRYITNSYDIVYGGEVIKTGESFWEKFKTLVEGT